MSLNWNQELSVGIKEIDEQHKKIFLYITELSNAINNNDTEEHIYEILEGLISYGIYHFDTEEKYFEEFDYPDKAIHLKEHNDFRTKIKELSLAFAENKDSISTDVLEFLEEWLIQHITKIDKKYELFLIKNGVK